MENNTEKRQHCIYFPTAIVPKKKFHILPLTWKSSSIRLVLGQRLLYLHRPLKLHWKELQSLKGMR